MLVHILEDLLRFDDMELLDALPFEQFNYSTKTFVFMKSMKKGASMDEAVNEMNASVEYETWRDRKFLIIDQRALNGMTSVYMLLEKNTFYLKA